MRFTRLLYSGVRRHCNVTAYLKTFRRVGARRPAIIFTVPTPPLTYFNISKVPCIFQGGDFNRVRATATVFAGAVPVNSVAVPTPRTVPLRIIINADVFIKSSVVNYITIR